jgi:hypothetical protein
MWTTRCYTILGRRNIRKDMKYNIGDIVKLYPLREKYLKGIYLNKQ